MSGMAPLRQAAIASPSSRTTSFAHSSITLPSPRPGTAAATSTGGMTDKRFGRVGDVPIIGAGTYANNKTAAISCTGYGEQFIRNNVAHDISAMMEYKGLSVQEAAEAVIQGKLDPGDGGAIAVAHDGSIAMVFNSKGMFRGAADSSGRFEVAIWE